MSNGYCNEITAFNCCLAEYAVKYVDLKRSGEEDQAKCVFEKMAKIKALIRVLCLYEPVVEDGFEETQGFWATITGSPFFVKRIDIGGVPIIKDFVINSSDSSVVNKELAKKFRSIQYRTGKLNIVSVKEEAKTTKVKFQYDKSVNRAAPTSKVNVSTEIHNGSVSVVPGELPEAVENSPNCITEDQVEDVISTLRDLCGCCCDDSKFNDTLPGLLGEIDIPPLLQPPTLGTYQIYDPVPPLLLNLRNSSGSQNINIDPVVTPVYTEADCVVTFNGQPTINIPATESKNYLIERDGVPEGSWVGGKWVLPPHVGGYQRPSDWLPLPTLVDGDQRFVALYAVWEDDLNLAAVQCTTINPSGSFEVDWGDGTVTTHITGATAEHQYDWATINPSTYSDRGYRQVIISITPVGVHEFNTVTTNVGHSMMTTRMVSGWLDASLASQTVTTLNSMFRVQYYQHALYLESFEYVGLCTATTSTYAFYNTNLCRLIGRFDMVNDANSMMYGTKPLTLDVTFLWPNVRMQYFLGYATAGIITGIDCRNTNDMTNFCRGGRVMQVGTKEDPMILNNPFTAANFAYQNYSLRAVYCAGTGGPSNINTGFRGTNVNVVEFGTMANASNVGLMFHQNYTLSKIDLTGLSITITLSGCNLGQEQYALHASQVAVVTPGSATYICTGNPETINATNIAAFAAKGWNVTP